MMDKMLGMGQQPPVKIRDVGTPNQQPNGADVQAAASIYIDVVLNGQKSVYELALAFKLRDALNAALAPFDEARRKELESRQAGAENPEGDQSPSPDDPAPQADGDESPVDGEASDPAA